MFFKSFQRFLKGLLIYCLKVLMFKKIPKGKSFFCQLNQPFVTHQILKNPSSLNSLKYSKKEFLSFSSMSFQDKLHYFRTSNCSEFSEIFSKTNLLEEASEASFLVFQDPLEFLNSYVSSVYQIPDFFGNYAFLKKLEKKINVFLEERERFQKFLLAQEEAYGKNIDFLRISSNFEVEKELSQDLEDFKKTCRKQIKNEISTEIFNLKEPIINVAPKKINNHSKIFNNAKGIIKIKYKEDEEDFLDFGSFSTKEKENEDFLDFEENDFSGNEGFGSGGNGGNDGFFNEKNNNFPPEPSDPFQLWFLILFGVLL